MLYIVLLPILDELLCNHRALLLLPLLPPPPPPPSSGSTGAVATRRGGAAAAAAAADAVAVAAGPSGDFAASGNPLAGLQRCLLKASMLLQCQRPPARVTGSRRAYPQRSRTHMTTIATHQLAMHARSSRRRQPDRTQRASESCSALAARAPSIGISGSFPVGPLPYSLLHTCMMSPLPVLQVGCVQNRSRKSCGHMRSTCCTCTSTPAPSTSCVARSGCCRSTARGRPCTTT